MNQLKYAVYVILLLIFGFGIYVILFNGDLWVPSRVREIKVALSFESPEDNKAWDPKIGSPNVCVTLENQLQNPIVIQYKTNEMQDLNFELYNVYSKQIDMLPYSGRFSVVRPEPAEIVLHPNTPRKFRITRVLTGCPNCSNLTPGRYFLRSTYNYGGHIYYSNYITLVLEKSRPVSE